MKLITVQNDQLDNYNLKLKSEIKKIVRANHLKRGRIISYLLGYISDDSRLKQWIVGLVGALTLIALIHQIVTCYLDLQNLFFWLYFYILGRNY